MQGLFVLVLAIASTTSAAAQQGVGGARAGGGVQCQGCDSAQLAMARSRWLEQEISKLTLELARNRILYENLQSRLIPDSPEPPRSEKERAELRASLERRESEMNRLVRELSARCGEQVPIRGHLGIVTEQTINSESSSAGRSITTMSYHVVHTVQPGSPAARAGLEPGDTIIAVNRTDARVRSLEPFLRTPGAKLNLIVGRAGGRREIAVIVGERPMTFGGGCMPYRDVRFMDPSGQNIVMYRQPGSAAAGAGGVSGRAGAAGAGQGGTLRRRVETDADGRPMRVVLSPDSTAHSTFIVIPPAGAGGVPFLPRGGSGAIVAGAEVSLVNGGLRTIFAVDYGALVLNVAPRSPAEQSGILSGDVIVRANGESVTAIAVLQRAIQAAHEKRSVVLDVIRAKQPRQVTLHW